MSSLEANVNSYLSRDGVPSFLFPITAMPLYSRVNLNQDSKDSRPQDDKYKNYFSKLTLNPLDFTGDISTGKSRSESYLSTHQVWRPVVHMEDSSPSDEDCNINNNIKESSFQSLYSSFVNNPTLLTDHSLNGLSYQSSVEMPDGIHIFGGLSCLSNEEYFKKLKLITRNFTIPPENIILKFDYDLPLPLAKDKLQSIACEPNRYHFRYNAGCNSLTKLLDLYLGEDHIDDNNSTTSNQVSGLSGLKAPKSVCCSSAAKISDRFYILYGGLELTEELKFNNDNTTCTIEKKLSTNNQFWVFDCKSHKYKEVKLSVHPTYSSIFANSVPRFGHQMVAVCANETNESTISSDLNLTPSDKKSSHRVGSPLSIVGYNDSNKSDQALKNKPSTPTSSRTSTSNSNVDYFSTDPHLEQLRKTHKYWFSRKKESSSGQFQHPAIVFVMGGYKLLSNSKSFIAINDLWKCEIFLDDLDVSDEILCSPIGNFDIVDGTNSYTLNTNGERLNNNSASNFASFSGVFQHVDSNGANWPCPRGFFSLALLDKSDIGQYFLHDTDESESVNEQYLPEVASPSPRNTNTLFPHFDDNLSTTLSGSPISTKSHPSIMPGTQQSKVNKTFITSPTLTSRTIDRGSSPISFEINSYNTDGHLNNSPFGEIGLGTSRISILESKILLVHAGSSILYTKVIDEESGEEHLFYHKKVLGDLWWFDFSTEKWNQLETCHKNAPMDLKICGHVTAVNDVQLSVFGGLQEIHFDSKYFKPVFDSSTSSNYDPKMCSLVEQFHEQMKNRFSFEETSFPSYAAPNDFYLKAGYTHEKSANNGETISKAQESSPLDKSHYTSYILNLQTKTWKSADYAYVRDLLLPRIWQQGATINNGGVCNTTEQYLLSCETTPYYLIFSIGFYSIDDAKVICIVSDTHLMDMKTNKVADTRQCVWGNGVCEIYSCGFSL